MSLRMSALTTTFRRKIRPFVGRLVVIVQPDVLLRRLALQLTAFAAGKARLPLLDGSRGPLSPLGMAFLAAPARRGSENSWFRRTGTFQASQDAGSPIPTDQQEFFLVVQWRRLLSKGLLQHSQSVDVPADLRTIAHHAWWCLLPLVRQYDVVMAQLLERSYQSYVSQGARATHEPFWVGFENEIDEQRFDKQAVALLNSRRTPEHDRDGFCEAASRWFMDGFSAAIHTPVQRHLGLCTVARHVRGQLCPTCPEIAKERVHLAALTIPLLTNTKIRQMLTFSGVADRARHEPASRVEALRWILESACIEDGVFPFRLPSGAPARFIDFGRLRRVWKALGFLSPFDQLPGPDTAQGPRESVKFFDRMMGGVISPNGYSEAALFVDAGWGEPTAYDVLYGGYAAALDSALACQIEIADKRAGALAKARAHRAQIHIPRKRPARRTVIRMFHPLEGPMVAVGVIRTTTVGKRSANFFTTPFEVDDPMLRSPQKRMGRGIREGDTFFWTLAALNYFANQQDSSGAPVYPLAREFCEWATYVEAELSDRKRFNEAIYSDRLGLRLDAIARGELAHLGAFSRYEDEQIQRFFVEQPKQKRLGDEQWAELLKVLPGRTKRGILRRFEELGKRYAFSHGYAEFMRSPYHRKFSAMRRKQWIKEGCAP